MKNEKGTWPEIVDAQDAINFTGQSFKIWLEMFSR